MSPAAAFAQTISEIEPVGATLLERAYAVPAADSVAVDTSNDVILARWQNLVYAFSIRCPHKGTRLEWRKEEKRVYCPKHKARFTANGAHVSGRGSRDLDRYAIRRDGQRIVVTLVESYRSDTEPDAWTKAVVSL
jgi:cytochrome b6-f complex iron-sulfur subunit